MRILDLLTSPESRDLIHLNYSFPLLLGHRRSLIYPPYELKSLYNNLIYLKIPYRNYAVSSLCARNNGHYFMPLLIFKRKLQKFH